MSVSVYICHVVRVYSTTDAEADADADDIDISDESILNSSLASEWLLLVVVVVVAASCCCCNHLIVILSAFCFVPMSSM